VKRIIVALGQRVESGQILVELDASEAQAELRTAEAQQARIRSELQVLSQGGRAADRTTLDTAIDKANLELKIAQDAHARAVRAREKQIGTEFEVRTAKESVDRLQSQIQGLQQQRASLVTKEDHSGAEARIEGCASLGPHRSIRLRAGVPAGPRMLC